MAGTSTFLHVHLRAWRVSLDLTLDQVGAKIGSKGNTLSGWETGSRKVDLDDLKKLADVYGVEPAALLYAPPSGKALENMREAHKILSDMDQDTIDHWLESGRRMRTDKRAA